MSDATITDLYEVTMALSYLHEGMTQPATFSCFVRALPPDRGFLIAAGAETVLDFLSGFAVGREDVEVFAEVLQRLYEGLGPAVGDALHRGGPGRAGGAGGAGR